jgi:hypothetical protein
MMQLYNNNFICQQKNPLVPFYENGKHATDFQVICFEQNIPMTQLLQLQTAACRLSMIILKGI